MKKTNEKEPPTKQLYHIKVYTTTGAYSVSTLAKNSAKALIDVVKYVKPISAGAITNIQIG